MTREVFKEGNALDFVYLAKNMAVCFLASIILLAISAFVLTFYPTDAIDGTVPIFLVGICTLLGGFRQARHAGRRGFVYGGITGVVYMLLLYLTGTLVLGELAFDSSNALSMVIGIGCGAVGGMIGVSKKKKNRRKK